MTLKINDIKAGLIKNVFIHAAIMAGALILSYNTYKKYVRGLNNTHIFSEELKIFIKATIPWAIIIFIALFILYAVAFSYKRNQNSYPSTLQYIILFAMQIIITNLIFLSKGATVLIVQNLGLFYFAILLFIWGGIKRIIVIDKTGCGEEIISPIIYELLHKNMLVIMEYFQARSLAHKFITIFITLFTMCEIFLIVGAYKIARGLAIVAYFFLVTGVGIKTYKLIKYGEMAEKK